MKIKQLVSLYGGQTALAGMLGIRQSAIAYWVKSDKIPGKWHQEMLSIAQKKGIDISATDLLAIHLFDKSSGTPDADKPSDQPNPYPVRPVERLGKGAEQLMLYEYENEKEKVHANSPALPSA